MEDKDKLEHLEEIRMNLLMSDQTSVPFNDIDAVWMKNKDDKKEPSYNVQNAVDSQSKLIYAINITNSPTDHYELPKIAQKLLENLKEKPQYISADTIYRNETTIQYLEKEGIEEVIPTRKQNKKI
jgi:Transposase DDE domain.